MNDLFELKIRELKALNTKHQLMKLEDYSMLFTLDESNVMSLLGCDHCYMMEAIPIIGGYSLPNGRKLSQLSKMFEESNMPHGDESENIWLCPCCQRVFKELIPEYIINS